MDVLLTAQHSIILSACWSYIFKNVLSNRRLMKDLLTPWKPKSSQIDRELELRFEPPTSNPSWFEHASLSPSTHNDPFLA